MGVRDGPLPFGARVARLLPPRRAGRHHEAPSPHKVSAEEKPPVVHTATASSSSSSSESSEEDESPELDGTWECGSEDFSKAISYGAIKQDCPKLLNPVNGCCIEHDACYDAKKGQAHCDEVFCACLDRVTYSENNETLECYESHSKDFCDAVKTFGEGFYEASGVNATVEAVSSGSQEDDKEAVKVLKLHLNQTSESSESKEVHIVQTKDHKTKRAAGGFGRLD
ncbi:Phospholipase A2-like protein Y52B11A.8 [Aphelenchoides fujianensis]|nr:Phospholipase A2-like protein Y52B11A.8 [Aphelenchoides fujianensis]